MSKRGLMPRSISPELIVAGDTIEVSHPETGGITVIKRGTVAYISVHGSMRNFLTQEGSVISWYEPGSDRAKTRFTLVNRAPEPTPMLDMFEEQGRL